MSIWNHSRTSIEANRRLKATPMALGPTLKWNFRICRRSIISCRAIWMITASSIGDSSVSLNEEKNECQEITWFQVMCGIWMRGYATLMMPNEIKTLQPPYILKNLLNKNQFSVASRTYWVCYTQSIIYCGRACNLTVSNSYLKRHNHYKMR